MTITRTDQIASTVLIVDKDPLTLTAIGAVVDMQGHRAVLARTLEVASQHIASDTVDMIVLAIEQLEPGCTFADALRASEKTREIPFIFLVPQMAPDWAARLAKHGGVFSMLQPVDPHALVELVEKSLWMPHIARSRSGAPPAHFAGNSDWIRLRD